MNIEKLIKEDKLDPINRLTVFYNEDKNIQCWGERIVCFLYAFDNYMQKFLQTKYNYYILDDLSIFNILNKLYTCDNMILNKTIITLDNAKVIYRFTVAKKFFVNDKTIKQLRLNSWGKEYYQCSIQKRTYEEIDNTVKKISFQNWKFIKC